MLLLEKDSASQQGPLIVFETREKRRPAILQGRGSLCFSKVVSSAAESRLILMYVYLSVFMRLIIFHSLYSAALEIELTPHQT